jgi:oxygen-independent coproporphyrinogen-3 oxidase
MAFGVYVHIPYCLQRCVYCDFATYEFSQILSPEKYITLVEKEIKRKSPLIGPRDMDTLYFGGGTPSLLEPEQLGRIITTLRDEGFSANSSSEITLEINPATLDEGKMEKLLKLGFNRFSVGAQTFNDSMLKVAHRKHDSKQTLDTLNLLKRFKVNYSADLLFALPNQSLGDLKKDIAILMEFGPHHISPYCLTVPETNPMARNRAPEDEQVEMFELIKNELEKSGYHRYEISNFSKPGFESRHNLLYWDDEPYWGIGLSSHSYMPWNDWGTRFWNPRGIEKFVEESEKNLLSWEVPENHENLKRHQSLTDYFHISLRKAEGLDKIKFQKKFDADLTQVAGLEVSKLIKRGLLEETPSHIRLTPQGVVLSNQAFQEFTFLS